MSNLSELLPAGAGAKSADFVASGTLGSGVTVALQSDGTVEAVGIFPESFGSPEVFESAAVSGGSGDNMAAVYDSGNDRVVVFYRDYGNSNYGTAVVGTISGTSISFGSPVVYESATVDYVRAAFDAGAGKTVTAYRDQGNSNYGTSVVGTVSGTSISFGATAVFESDNVHVYGVAFDSSAGKVVISYIDYGNNAYGTAIVGTVSGTSISFGSATVFDSVNLYSSQGGITYNAASDVVVMAYRDASVNSNWGAAIVGTVSGTSISFGSKAYFENGTISSGAGTIAITYDSTNGKVVTACADGGNSNRGTAAVGTVSGTSISFGTPVVFETGEVVKISATYDATNNKINIVYADNGNSSKGTLVVGAVSGTTISFETPVIFNDGVTNQEISATFDSAQSVVFIAYADDSNSSYGTGKVFKNEYSNNTDFIGITDQAIADTATGAVIVQGGVNSKLSGLTVGADYYVQDDGALASADGVPYDISSAIYVQNFSISAQETTPKGVAFNPDGTKMFIVGSAGDEVNEYDLSVGFDVSSGSYSKTFSVAAQDTVPDSIAFNPTGTKMFIGGGAGQDVNEYSLSGAFDIATASFIDSFSISAQDTGASGIAFNSDGTKMVVLGTSNTESVFGYNLSVGFDVSSATYASESFSVASQITGVSGLTFSPDGTKMFVVGTTGDAVVVYNLSVAFNVSTAVYAGVTFSVAPQDIVPTGIAFSADGTKMFVVGGVGQDVNQYSTTPASTTVPAGRALSSTSILLEG